MAAPAAMAGPVQRRIPTAPTSTDPISQVPARRPAAPRQTRRATAKAAARRRHILAVLLIADLVVGAGAVTGLLLPWAPAVPVGLTLLFLVVARVTVRREQARRKRELQERRTAQRPTAPLVADVPAPKPGRVEPSPLLEWPLLEPALDDVVTAERNDQGLSVVGGLDDTSSIPVVRVDGAAAAGSLWDPLPVTLPTYVTKPRASRSVRTIDLSAPDVSSSGRSSAASALVAEAATVAPDSGGEDEAPRAVGS